MVLAWRCRSPSKPEQTMSFKPSTTHQKRKKRWVEEFTTNILCLFEKWLVLQVLANICLNLMLLSDTYIQGVEILDSHGRSVYSSFSMPQVCSSWLQRVRDIHSMFSTNRSQPQFSLSWWSSLPLSQIINYQLVLSTGWSPTERRNQHQRHHLLLRNWDRVSCSWWQRRWCFIGRIWTNNVVNVLCS